MPAQGRSRPSSSVSDVVVFLDANVLASPVTRTLVIAGGRADGLLITGSAHVESEADRHARSEASRTSAVRRDILGMRLSTTAPTTEGLATASPDDRQVIADAAQVEARFLVTTDVDDFAPCDLQSLNMSAVNPDYFMALRFSERAYREGVRTLAEVARSCRPGSAEGAREDRDLRALRRDARQREQQANRPLR